MRITELSSYTHQAARDEDEAQKSAFPPQKVTHIRDILHANPGIRRAQVTDYSPEAKTLSKLVENQSKVTFPSRALNRDYSSSEDVSAADEEPGGFLVGDNLVGFSLCQDSKQVEAWEEFFVLQVPKVSSSIEKASWGDCFQVLVQEEITPSSFQDKVRVKSELCL